MDGSPDDSPDGRCTGPGGRPPGARPCSDRPRPQHMSHTPTHQLIALTSGLAGAGPEPRRRTLAVAAAASLLLAACGGGGEGEVPLPVGPTLEIRSDVVGEARSPSTVTFFFSGPVVLPTGTLVFSLSGASIVAGSFRRIDDRTCSVQLRPNASAQGLIDLRVPAGAYRDGTGQVSNTVAYAFAQPYDTLPPLASLSFSGPVDPLGFLAGAGTFTLTFTGVLDAPLVSARLLVSTGTVSAFTKTSGTAQPDVYTFTYTPPPATRGFVTFLLPADSVTRQGIGNDDLSWSYGLAAP